jgi:hypothetical protein
MHQSPIIRVTSTILIGLIFVGCASQNTPSRNSPVASSGSKTTYSIPISLKLNPLWWFATSKPPVDYKPNYALRRLDWFFRNPLHNFTFYVIGISDHFGERAYHRYGTHPNDNFSPTPGWNFCVIHYHWLRLPFIAYWNPHMSFYFGWRLAGEFGVKINFFRHPVKSL